MDYRYYRSGEVGGSLAMVDFSVFLGIPQKAELNGLEEFIPPVTNLGPPKVNETPQFS